MGYNDKEDIQYLEECIRCAKSQDWADGIAFALCILQKKKPMEQVVKGSDEIYGKVHM